VYRFSYLADFVYYLGPNHFATKLGSFGSMGKIPFVEVFSEERSWGSAQVDEGNGIVFVSKMKGENI